MAMLFAVYPGSCIMVDASAWQVAFVNWAAVATNMNNIIQETNKKNNDANSGHLTILIGFRK